MYIFIIIFFARYDSMALNIPRKIGQLSSLMNFILNYNKDSYEITQQQITFFTSVPLAMK